MVLFLLTAIFLSIFFVEVPGFHLFLYVVSHFACFEVVDERMGWLDPFSR